MTGLLALVMYVLVYVFLSWQGGYVFTQSGQVRYDYGYGLSVTDVLQWQPRWVFCQRFQRVDGSWTLRANRLGYVFAPMILLDQMLVHRSTRVLHPTSQESADQK